METSFQTVIATLLELQEVHIQTLILARTARYIVLLLIARADASIKEKEFSFYRLSCIVLHKQDKQDDTKIFCGSAPHSTGYDNLAQARIYKAKG